GARSSVTRELATPCVAASKKKLEPSVTRKPNWRRLSASTVGYRTSASVPCAAVNHTFDWRPAAVPIASLSPVVQWSGTTLAAGATSAVHCAAGRKTTIATTASTATRAPATTTKRWSRLSL